MVACLFVCLFLLIVPSVGLSPAQEVPALLWPHQTGWMQALFQIHWTKSPRLFYCPGSSTERQHCGHFQYFLYLCMCIKLSMLMDTYVYIHIHMYIHVYVLLLFFLPP